MRRFLIFTLFLGLSTGLGFSREVTITILATTDTHGNVNGFDYATDQDLGYGLTQIATQINNLRGSRKNLILVDCGDAISGNALTFYHKHFASDQPNPVIAAMNEMEYDVAVPGNHEFDFGLDYLAEAISTSSFPWISANIVQEQTGQPLLSGTVVLEREGVRIGFFGLTTPATARTLPPATLGGMAFQDMVESARNAVASLKAQGVNLVVGLVHSGRGEKVQTGTGNENAVYQVIEQVEGIDIILFGHSHGEVPLELYKNVLLCQPKDHAQSLAVVMVDLQQRDGQWEILAKTSTTLKTVGLTSDKKVERKARKMIRDCQDFVKESLGTYDTELVVSENPLTPRGPFYLLSNAVNRWNDSDVVVVPMMEPGMEIKSERADFLNRHVFRLLPYDNYVIRFQLNGEQLKGLIEQDVSLLGSDAKLLPGVPFYRFANFGGVQYSVNMSAAQGERVTVQQVAGKPFDAAATYSIAMTGYQYGLGAFFSGEKPQPLEWSDVSLRQMVRNYILGLQDSGE